jgi:hypothetical protein
MRFQKGESGNPAGRPRGALNRATVMAQELLAARVESIANKLIELAEGGDMRAIRVCIERIVPAPQHQQIAVERPPSRQASSRRPRPPDWRKSSTFTSTRSTAKASTNASASSRKRSGARRPCRRMPQVQRHQL